MTALKLRLFGVPTFEQDEVAVSFGRRKALALAAYIAMTKQPQSRETLLGLLWPDFDSTSARNNLRRELSLLNSLFETDLLVADRTTVELNRDTHLWIDVEDFLAKIAAAEVESVEEQPVSAARIELLCEAVATYTNDFLAGFTVSDSAVFEEWQFFESQQLQRRLDLALQTLVRWLAESQAYERAIPYAQRWVALDPLHEPAQQQLMSLFAWNGQHTAALRQYEQCVEILDIELGVSPEDATIELFESIRAKRFPPRTEHKQTLVFGLERTGAASGNEDIQSTGAIPNNLPAKPVALIGREYELSLLEQFCDDESVRLLTLAGQGGMGKTSMALAFAKRQMDRGDNCADGIFFVPLAALSGAGRLVYALAEAIGFALESVGRPPSQQILEYLANKRMVLVLDNYEHLLPDVTFICEILRQAPHIRILVTSRERLYVQDEHLLALEGLDYPDEEVVTAQEAAAYPAVQLLVDRARRVQHDFTLDDDNCAAVVRICRQTAGMPLALEMAAAWSDVLPMAEIAGELQRNLDLLTTNRNDLPPRQHSMRAVFDASWQYLSTDEQEIFAQLSIFRGGFTRDAVRRIVLTHDGKAASLQALAALVGKSWLQYNRRQDRYYIHELLRQYGDERLQQGPEGSPESAVAVFDRHCAYFCAIMQEWLGGIEGARKRETLLAIDADFENVQVAWNWADQHNQVARLDKAISTLEHYSYWRSRFPQAEQSYRAAADRIQAGLSTLPATVYATEPSESRYVLACLLARRANFLYLLKDWEKSEALFEHSRQLLRAEAALGRDVREEEAYILMKMGDLTKDTEVARRRFADSLALYQAVGHRWWAAGLLTHLGYIALATGRYADAERYFQEGLALYEVIGDRWQFGWVLDGLSNVALQQRRLDEARRYAEESLTIHREIGVRDRIAGSLVSLSWIVLAQGHREEARRLYGEAVSIWNNLGTAVGVPQPDSPESQPFQPLWFKEITQQRAAVASDAKVGG